MQQNETQTTISQADDWQTTVQARISALELSMQLLREDLYTAIERNRALEREVKRLTTTSTVARSA